MSEGAARVAAVAGVSMLASCAVVGVAGGVVGVGVEKTVDVSTPSSASK